MEETDRCRGRVRGDQSTVALRLQPNRRPVVDKKSICSGNRKAQLTIWLPCTQDSGLSDCAGLMVSSIKAVRAQVDSMSSEDGMGAT